MRIHLHLGSILAHASFSGQLWMARWWSYADIPGGVAGDWQLIGVCPTSSTVVATVKPQFEAKEVPLTVPITTPAAALAAKEKAHHKKSRAFRF